MPDSGAVTRRRWIRCIGAATIVLSYFLIISIRFALLGVPSFPIGCWMLISGRISLIAIYIGAFIGIFGLHVFGYWVLPFFVSV